MFVELGAEVASVRIRDDGARISTCGQVLPHDVLEPELLGPGHLDGAVDGSAECDVLTAEATSSAAIGWISAAGTRTVPPSVASFAMRGRNSKNCVAWTIENGTDDALTSRSCAILARM